MRENVCPWDEETCEYAAGGRNLEVLQWAHANGCPWDEWAWGVTGQHVDERERRT